MTDGGVGVKVGGVAMFAGLLLIVILNTSDFAALGGGGLMVLGALIAAISFDDRSDDAT